MTQLAPLLTLEEGAHNLQSLTDLACVVLPSADGAAIASLDCDDSSAPRLRNAAYTDGWVKAVDEQQYAAGEGPCFDSLARQQVINLRSLNGHYPEFTEKARDAGVGSVLAAPIEANEKPVGVVIFYSKRPQAFDGNAEDRARTFASHAALTMFNVGLAESARNLRDQLATVMEDSAVIEQAKGIVMGREGCSAQQALDRLTRGSQSEHLTVAEMASKVIDDLASEKGDGVAGAW